MTLLGLEHSDPDNIELEHSEPGIPLFVSSLQEFLSPNTALFKQKWHHFHLSQTLLPVSMVGAQPCHNHNHAHAALLLCCRTLSFNTKAQLSRKYYNHSFVTKVLTQVIASIVFGTPNLKRSPPTLTTPSFSSISDVVQL